MRRRTDAVRTVLHTHLAPVMHQRLLNQVLPRLQAALEPHLLPTPVLVQPLPERQHQVLRGLARGLRRAEIAAELGLHKTTIPRHLQALYRSLGADRHDRGQAVAIAYENGLLP